MKILAGALTLLSTLASYSLQAETETPLHQTIEGNSPDLLHTIENKKTLSLEDIKQMTQLGISDDKIISKIRVTNSTYYLSSSDIKNLEQAGVSKRVIAYMKQTTAQ